MAGSRLEKIGTIYTRTTGLLRSGALSWQDRPLWYDIYEAFPPSEEPRFDRPIPNIKLKSIFYKEDKIRAMFHRNNKHVGTTNMFNDKYTSLTQKFIQTYQKLESENQDLSEEDIYKQAIDVLKRDREVRAGIEDEEAISLSLAFKEAKSKQDPSQNKVNIDVTDIFK